ncbi:MAG: HAD family hydrolase [Candidatus Cryptobacteroides sp.]
MTKLAIFDLDGTLIDTIEDLGTAVNHALGLRGLALHSMAEYKDMVGHGVRNLVKDALAGSLGRQPEDALVDSALADFVDYYVAHIDVHTRPYPGIQALLSKLQGKGLKLAVASNKFQEGAEKLVKEFFPDIRFVAVLGNSPELPLKPDAAVVQLVLDKAGVSREEAVFVGDSATDMKTAANGGVRSIGVSWGFRPRTDLEQSGAMDIADSAEQLFEKI